MKELQILMAFAKDSKSEVIRRANGSHELTNTVKDLVKIWNNKVNKN